MKNRQADSPTTSNVPPGTQPLWTRRFILLAVANLFLFFGFQMLLPTIPAFVTELGGDNSAIGMVIFILTISALLVRPFAGAALDMFPGRLILIIGPAIALAAIGSYILAASIAVIYLLRIVHGIGWGISTTTFGTMASDIIPASRRGEGMGYFGLASTLAMALGPMSGIAIMKSYDFPVLFGVSFALTGCSLLVCLLLGNKEPSNPDAGQHKPAAEPQGGVLSRLVDKTALFPSLLMFLIAVTYGGIVSFITLFGNEQNIANVGWFFTVNALMVLLVRPISGKIYDTKGHVSVLLPGAVFSLIGMLVLSYTTGTATLVLAAACYGIGFGAIQPSLQAWTVQRAAPNRRGAANATFFSSFDLGIGLGALLLGPIAAATNYAVMYRLSCIMFLLFLVIYIAYVARQRKAASLGGSATES